MIIDIVIGVIIISFAILGYRDGFMRSFLQMAGWILATVLAFVWFPHVKEFILTKTDFYDSVYNNLYGKFSDSMPKAEDTFNHLPSIIGKGYEFLSTNIATAASSGFADFIFTILSFLAVILAIKLVFFLITMALSKKNNDGLPGFVDGLLGCFFGLIKGVFFVFIILAFFVPMIGLSNWEHAETIMDAIYNSTLTLELYDNNLLLLIVRDFMG